MTQDPYTEKPQPTRAVGSEEGINVIDLAIVLARRKWILAITPLVVAAATAIYVFLQPDIYTATTRLLPPQQSQPSGGAALLGQLGSLAGGALGIKGPSDVYVSMLKSRTLADSMIVRLGLQAAYKHQFLSDTRSALQAKTFINTSRDGVITIEVEDKDPEQAAKLANIYVEELVKLSQSLAVTQASRSRLFIEQQLALTKDQLTEAELAARKGLQQGGLAKVDDQGRSVVAVTASLRAKISAKEVEVGAMRTFAAERNPDFVRAQDELNVLKRELARTEGGRPASPGSGDGKASDAGGIDSVQRLRDVKYFESIYELLAKQLALAKIDEAKEATVIQVLDRAIVPERKTKPLRRLIVTFAALAGLIAGIPLAFAIEAASNALRDPEQSERLRNLRQHLSLRSKERGGGRKEEK